MDVENILEFPLEIWEPIVKLCDRKSLINLALCSKKCYELLFPTLFEGIHVKWSELSTVRKLLSSEKLKFTKSLSFKDNCTGDSLLDLYNGELSDDWEKLVNDFKLLIHSCDSLKLKNLFISNKSIEDSDLVPVFRKFINIREITLYGCNKLTGTTFECISHLKSLQKLSLTSCYVTDKYFLSLTSLMELSIRDCVGDLEGDFDIISQLSGLKKLTFVDNLKYNFNVHEPFELSIENIKNIPLLEHLDVSMSCIPNEADIISVLANLKSLKVLDLSKTKLTNSLDSISHMNSLTELRLSDCDLDDEKLALIKKLKYLHNLSINTNNITDVSMMHVSELVSLRSLDICYDEMISDKGIKHLISLVHLEKIFMDGCYYLTDRSLVYLSRLPCLKKLAVEETEMSEETLQHLKKLKGWDIYKRWWE